MGESVKDVLARQQMTPELQRDIERQGLAVRLGQAVMRWVEYQNLKYSRVGNPPVYDTRAFPWAAKVEAAAPAIRAELDRLLVRREELPGFHEIARDVEAISVDTNWRTFMLCAYGHVSEEATRLCPETWRALQYIPGLKAAMFSIFEPGKHLPPHRGPYNGVLRFHLGLKVPKTGDVAIRIADHICHWEEGKALIFDDAYRHEAWNYSDEVRVVLFVDFAKPERFPGSLLNGAMLWIARWTPFIREGYAAQKRWERIFFGRGKTVG
ncbi:MAG: aspartyl/asparaginyl beta-hydroxylase domain-containing protein [Bauldia sp.]|nr:aspartyl/asparaginyl beta-hydroxylase domain-containing protein [Bauldia sp.]